MQIRQMYLRHRRRRPISTPPLPVGIEMSTLATDTVAPRPPIRVSSFPTHPSIPNEGREFSDVYL